MNLSRVQGRRNEAALACNRVARRGPRIKKRSPPSPSLEQANSTAEAGELSGTFAENVRVLDEPARMWKEDTVAGEPLTSLEEHAKDPLHMGTSSGF